MMKCNAFQTIAPSLLNKSKQVVGGILEQYSGLIAESAGFSLSSAPMEWAPVWFIYFQISHHELFLHDNLTYKFCISSVFTTIFCRTCCFSTVFLLFPPESQAATWNKSSAPHAGRSSAAQWNAWAVVAWCFSHPTKVNRPFQILGKKQDLFKYQQGRSNPGLFDIDETF